MNKQSAVQKLSSLSLFFPAYNEEANIARAVEQALAVLPTVVEKFEIIVINDGSTDKTKQISQKLANKYKTVRLVSQRNKGYGGAVKRGFAAAKYSWIFFTDSDLQFNLHELPKLVKKTNDNDLVLGFRKNRAEGLRRTMLAKALKLWNRVFLGFPSGIKDIDCAFKLMRREVIKTVEPLISDGAMVSTELLLKAHRAGFRYRQVGVRHYQRQYGKPTGSDLRVILRAVRDTFVLRKRLMVEQVRTWAVIGSNGGGN